ncbi:phage tail protein [Pseudoalteromonas phenolica]|jgi:microcystin-dependent protein|uniref:phage tail protein n=1 Tax=Pseudoalteromonas phenolica TaxID=161398 RepID=UPI00384D1FAD
MAEPFIGEVRMFAFNYAPRGWAFCDGQLLPIAENTALFAIIGTTYGGDGRTTFAVPDLEARAPMQPGHAPGLSYRRLGDIEGVIKVFLTEGQIPPHNHDVQVSGTLGTDENPDAQYAGFIEVLPGEQGVKSYKDSPLNTGLMSVDAIDTAGAGDGHYNVQPMLVVNFCIALDGIFPPRN